MATINVYLPDELKERLEKSGLRLSEVARECWENELSIQEIVRGAGEIRLDAMDENGPVELRFAGKLVARSFVDGRELYVTDNRDFVFVEEEGYEFISSVEMDGDTVADFFERDPEAAASAAAALGLKRVIRL